MRYIGLNLPRSSWGIFEVHVTPEENWDYWNMTSIILGVPAVTRARSQGDPDPSRAVWVLARGLWRSRSIVSAAERGSGQVSAGARLGPHRPCKHRGIPEAMVCRILMFMWSFGPLLEPRHGSKMPQDGASWASMSCVERMYASRGMSCTAASHHLFPSLKPHPGVLQDLHLRYHSQVGDTAWKSRGSQKQCKK